MKTSELLRTHAESLGHSAATLLAGDVTLDPVGLVLDGEDAEAREIMEKIEGISAEAILSHRVVQTIVRRPIALAILREVSPEAALALDTKRTPHAIPLVAIGEDGVAIGRIEWGLAQDA